ncbi:MULTISPECIES: ABC transporter permease subunit [Holdemanella]|jgi:methyl-galactoside transport system permease protein|uniref:ABC transporter permease subunit n=1 Tax=Holdemanella TaxID=1573535 RepID=UPI001C3866FC|nr:galactoside ABC transporter permease [Holdemanella biformis]MBV4131923.1 galactoside ABC transporter permease [Holdemanella biformis]MBV4151675.1 galactoside ABC transporter permease [Holdemanella biformis]MEE0667907.1 galactoside ABC transporter permease [Holdemanella biformis]
MTNTVTNILSRDEELALRKPIEDYVGKIQAEIDELREEGTNKVLEYSEEIEVLKRDKIYTKSEKEARISELNGKLQKAKEIEAKNKQPINDKIAVAEKYLKDHYQTDYYNKVVESNKYEVQKAKADYDKKLKELEKEHKDILSGLSDKEEIKEENFIYKNRLFDAKLEYTKNMQEAKDRKHDAFTFEYHLIDLLKMSNFSFAEKQAQKFENYKYSFNTRDFLLKNGLYIAIILVFIFLCIITPIKKNGLQLFTVNNILSIMQQASPRMFLALGVSGLIMLAGTDLSVGRMVGMGMTAATIIMHNGPNTGSVFGHVFDFSTMPVGGRILLALVVCVVLCTMFTTIAGFFAAKFKMHPFISTMANMLVIFGLVTYSTKGVSFGGIEQSIPGKIIPKVGGFPTIILWAVAAVVIVWFIWNKTKFGKNLYAVGGNPEAASVSGISVFKVTLGAFIMAGILYGFGSWLECIRMIGSGSAAYGQGWEMDAIAACVVGGVSFTGGIGKISGVVVGVLIFTALTYSLTILGIDTNLQFVFSGIIILIAVTLDCLKYVRKN